MISVIVPIYNVEEYLEECLQSIQSQTYKDFECIMVNDGSTDSSPEIAQRFVNNDERFKLIHQENAGLSAARNTGIKYVNGDFLTFVDSDDILLSIFFKVCMDNIEDVDIVEVRDIVFKSGEKLLDEIVETPIMNVTYKTAKETLIAVGKYKLSNSVCTKFFRSVLKEDIFFPEGRINEDLPVTLHLCRLGYTIKKIDYAGYGYRKRTGSIMNSCFSEKDWDLFYVCDQIEDEYKDEKELLPYIYKILALNVVLQFCQKTNFTFNPNTKHKKIIRKYGKRAIKNSGYIKLSRVSTNLIWIIDYLKRKKY